MDGLMLGTGLILALAIVPLRELRRTEENDALGGASDAPGAPATSG